MMTLSPMTCVRDARARENVDHLVVTSAVYGVKLFARDHVIVGQMTASIGYCPLQSAVDV